MMALLSPRVWLGLALMSILSITHVFVYNAGRAAVRVDWGKERAVQMADALAASESFRVKEKDLNASNLKVANAYIAHKKISAAAAVVSAGRLRDLQAGISDITKTDTTADNGSDGAFARISSECSSALVSMDGYASELAGKAKALQDFTREVCLKN